LKVALLSDVHGNAEAFKVAVRSAQQSKCELFIISGDLVGYYYEIQSVLDLLFQLNFKFIRGNHEIMLKRLIEKPELSNDISSKYGSALTRTISDLSTTDLDFLCAAPDTLTIAFEGYTVNVSHGSPWKFDEYIYPDSQMHIWDKFLSFNEDVFVIGNTHHQLLKRYNGKLIINPGSIGQSRTDNRMAQWAEFDTLTRDVTFKSHKYDSTSLLMKCLKFDPNLKLLRKSLES
jgi:putative phosphoesterase